MGWLITGGCGFVGSNLAKRLIEKGNEKVIIIDNLSRLGAKDNLKWLTELDSGRNNLAFHEIDVSDEKKVGSVIAREAKDIEAIAHLAGQVAMTTSLSDPRLDLLTNVLGTFNVLESVREHCPNATLMYSSTNKVYGDLEHLEYVETEKRYEIADYPGGLPEEIGLDFSSPYGCSKGSADQYVRDWHRIYNLKTVVFRHSSMYGGRQFSTYDQGWIGWFCQKAIEQQAAKKRKSDCVPFTISGNGKQVRDVLYADDLVDLYLMANEKIESIAGSVFNIGGGLQNSLSILELFHFLNATLGIELNYTNLEPRKADQRVFIADNSKVENMLGWKPEMSAQAGILKMIDWQRQILK